MSEGQRDVLSSEENEDNLLLSLFILRRRKRRHRRYRVHPVWTRRREQGAHDNLVREMVLFDQVMFREYTRMTVEQYEELLQQIGPHLLSAPTRQDVITPSEKLLVTIRYLATGESFSSLSQQFRMGRSSLQSFIPKVLNTIWEIMQPSVLNMPETPEDWQKIIDNFQRKWQFPHCWGAIDGKHVVMQAQPHSGSQYFNYKRAHSINLLAICDADYKFIIIEVGAKGRESDGGILRRSNFGKRLFSRTLNLPAPTELYPASLLIPHFCLGDEAFPLDINLLRPFPGRSTDRMPNDQLIFNYRLSRARRVIENTFGNMVSQWRIFHIPNNASLETIKFIVLGAVCLHNYLRKKEENLPEDMQHYCPAIFMDRSENGAEIEAQWQRDLRMDALTPLPTNYIESLSAVRIREVL